MLVGFGTTNHGLFMNALRESCFCKSLEELGEFRRRDPVGYAFVASALNERFERLNPIKKPSPKSNDKSGKVKSGIDIKNLKRLMEQ